MFNSSIVLNLINKLDISENPEIYESIKNSFFVRKISNLIDFIQDKTQVISQSSKLIENIDYLIMLILSLTLISITFSSTGIIGFLTISGLLLLLIKFFLIKGEKHTFNAFDIPIFAYIAIAGLSVAFSSLFMPSLKGYVKMLIYFGGYLTFINTFKNHPKRMIFMMGVLAVSASLEAFYAIYQQIAGVEQLASWQDVSRTNPEQLMNRVYGSLKPFNPNLLAGYLVASFSSTLGLAFWFTHKKNWKAGIAGFIGTAAILLAIVLTGSRGAYVATAAMMGIFTLISGHIIWHEYSDKKWLKQLWLGLIVLGVLAVLAAVISSPSLQHRIASIFAFRDDSSNSFRMNVYISSFKMFLDNWLIGIGPGNTTFRLMYGLYMVTGFDALGAYCVPLEVAVESGIFGLLAFLWLIVLSYIKGIKHICSKAFLDNKIIVSSCLIGITGMMVHGFVDTIWYRPQVNILFWMTIAILATMTSNYLTNKKES